MDSGRTVTGWLTCRVADRNTVATLRDHLYGWLCAPEPYRREEDPHVSVFGFRLPEEEFPGFRLSVQRFSERVGSWSGAVTGYHIYPSVRNPMVVTLEVPFPLEAVASPLSDILAAHGGRRTWGPTHPHITLFKGGVPGEELQWAQVPEETRERLRAVTGDDTTPLSPPERLVEPTFEVTLELPAVELN